MKGRAYLCRSTVGWQVCCQWRDRSTYWETFSDLKEFHPVDTVEYAHFQGISHEPAFNWWAPHVLKKHDHIISLVRKRNPRYLNKTHMFGIEVPTIVSESLELCKKHADGIASDMNNMNVAFDDLPDG